MAFPMFPLRSQTERGVTNLRWSLLLALAMQALGIVALAPVAYYLAYPPSGYYYGGTVALFPLALTVGMLGGVAVMFFLSGLSRLQAGRDEYGPAHARNAEAAMILTVLAFVVGVSALAFSGPFWVAFGQDEGTGLAMTGALAIARGLFVGLAFMYAVRALLRPEERQTGLLATALLAAGPAVGTAGLWLLVPHLSGYLYFGAALGGIGVEAAVEVAAYVLLFRQYSRLESRLRSGEQPPLFRPLFPPTPYYPYPPYPAPYYPTYPGVPAPPYPGPAPPPQTPPPQQRPDRPIQP